MEAHVQQIAEAYATDSSATARLVWTVNTTTNSATIEQTAAEGYADGTWNGSAINLAADLITLLAKDINFGTNTAFEDTYGTIYTTKNSKRLRILGPFPASDDIVLWFGPTSVALNSETKTNGHFALATDGKIYLGADVAGAMTGAVTNKSLVSHVTAATSKTTDSVTVTPQGGSGYTYAWTKVSGVTVTVNSASSATTTFSYSTAMTAGQSIEAVYRCTVTETATGKKAQVDVGVLFVHIGI